MPLEHQVTSLEVSQKMKALGFKQESAFFWRNQHRDWDKNHWLHYPVYAFNEDTEIFATADDINGVSAYLSSELGEMLPAGTSTRKGWGMDSGYVMFDNEANKICSADTEADARAKMLIYLAENGLIDPKNI